MRVVDRWVRGLRGAILPAVLLAACSCGGGDEGAGERVPVPSRASGAAGAGEAAGADEAAGAGEAAGEPRGLEGTFVNSDGAVLTLSGVVPGTSFAFALEVARSEGGDDDPCGGVSYQGTARFSDATHAASEEEDSFRFEGDALHFEPAVAMVGMECTSRFDVDFTRR